MDLDTLTEPGAMLSLKQVDDLIACTERLSGRTDLGMCLGRQIKPSSHESLGYALMTSANLDEALQLASRYWQLITPAFSLRRERDSHGIRITVEAAIEMSPACLRFHIETIATAIHEELRFLLSDQIPAYEILLPEALPIHSGIRRWLVPARVKIGSVGSGLQMLIPEHAATRPLALADKTALKIARQRCEEALARMTIQGSLGDWVKLMLDKAHDHQPRQHELARILHVSTRTMNRRLAAEGTSFRELGRLTRQARARQMLSDGRLSITRIALQLGYRDSANFTRAFRLENGITPALFRRRSGSN
jgi:AraC-like DNA-binding protein